MITIFIEIIQQNQTLLHRIDKSDRSNIRKYWGRNTIVIEKHSQLKKQDYKLNETKYF